MKATLPDKFKARIGGYLGWSFSVALTPDGLEYTEFAGKFLPVATKILTPSAARWQAFRHALEKADVWRWKKEYANPDVADGTVWEFTCEWDGLEIRTAGSNAWPGDADPNRTATDPMAESKRFDHFLRAISELLGGEPFE
ncbi:MAG: hypothetical protein EOM72_10510 [Opitutae bacterium]|nr:hypothetical protein [Opitutae bacterium]